MSFDLFQFYSSLIRLFSVYFRPSYIVIATMTSCTKWNCCIMLYNSIRHNVCNSGTVFVAVILEVFLLLHLLTWHIWSFQSAHTYPYNFLYQIHIFAYLTEPRYREYLITMKRVRDIFPFMKVSFISCVVTVRTKIIFQYGHVACTTKRNWYSSGFRFLDEILKRIPNVKTTSVLPSVSVWPSIKD